MAVIGSIVSRSAEMGFFRTQTYLTVPDSDERVLMHGLRIDVNGEGQVTRFDFGGELKFNDWMNLQRLDASVICVENETGREIFRLTNPAQYMHKELPLERQTPAPESLI